MKTSWMPDIGEVIGKAVCVFVLQVVLSSKNMNKSCVVNKNINLALYSLRVCIYVDNTKYMLGFMLLMFLLVMMYISKDIITVLQYKRSDRINSFLLSRILRHFM